MKKFRDWLLDVIMVSSWWAWGFWVAPLRSCTEGIGFLLGFAVIVLAIWSIIRILYLADALHTDWKKLHDK